MRPPYLPVLSGSADMHYDYGLQGPKLPEAMQQNVVERLRLGLREHGAPCARLAFVSSARVLAVAVGAVAALLIGLLIVFRYADPPMSSLMLSQRLAGIPLSQRWTPLSQISPNLVRAVIVSEDGQFCRHRGVDFRELDEAMKRAERGGLEQVRGASTITMQVAKNLFLWPAKDLVRKGLELGTALTIEAFWPKRRIIEVYLNIAEWGPGIFGAEAAARYHFKKPAARLTEREAALLAAALPNPIVRTAGAPGPGLRRLAQVVEMRTRSGGQRAACVLGGRFAL